MTFNKKLYNLYIKNYDWYIRKNDYINSLDIKLCELCKINKWEDVHHQNYDSLDFNNPGNELDEHLIYVCKECHNDIHTLAIWEHSTRQEDMDKWLKLLEEKNKIRFKLFEENKEKERLLKEEKLLKNKINKENEEIRRFKLLEKEKNENEKKNRNLRLLNEKNEKENKENKLIFFIFIILYIIFIKIFNLAPESASDLIWSWVIFWFSLIPIYIIIALLIYIYKKFK